MDTTLLDDEDAELYEAIKASGEYRVALRRDGIEVLVRIRPSGDGSAPIPAAQPVPAAPRILSGPTLGYDRPGSGKRRMP